jgi:hypothetical protein
MNSVTKRQYDKMILFTWQFFYFYLSISNLVLKILGYAKEYIVNTHKSVLNFFLTLLN